MQASSACVLACLLVLAGGCESEHMDGSDLRGVFDHASASAMPLAKVAPKATRKRGKRESEGLPPPPPPTERTRVTGPCIKPGGKAAKMPRRKEGRPACRRARVLEQRAADATPRYGCVFSDRAAARRKPLPLVIFLHGEYDDPTAVHRKTRLRRRYAKLDLSGDPKRSGFVVLAPQARRTEGLLRWDVGHHERENLDAVAFNGFIDVLLEEGAVDARQIYVIGESQGGVMAALYAHLYPERVAAFGTFGADASKLVWTCDQPPPPAAILYRACDTVTRCADVERWLGRRDEARAPTFSMRLGSAKATAPSCALSASACRQKRGAANHARWPKPREREMLEYLSRFSFKR